MRIIVLGPVVALLVAVVLISIPALSMSDPTPPLPQDLYKKKEGRGGKRIAVFSDLKKTCFDWDSAEREIYVSRLERPNDQTTSWNTTVQTLTTSFDISSAYGVCNSDSDLDSLYVAGAYPNGTSTIEEWKFTYTPPMGGLDPLPKVSRSVLYQGTDVGIIADAVVNDDQSLLVFLTTGKSIYSLALPGGPLGLSAPQLLYSPSTLPDLAEARYGLEFMRHVAEGSKYTIRAYNPLLGLGSDTDKVIVLLDANNDNQIEGYEIVTLAQWDLRGYRDGAAWMTPCYSY